MSDLASPSHAARARRKRFNLTLFLHTVEFAAFRIAVTASFLYCLYHVFMKEIGR